MWKHSFTTKFYEFWAKYVQIWAKIHVIIGASLFLYEGWDVSKWMSIKAMI